jgi:acyl-CoA thioesterase I
MIAASSIVSFLRAAARRRDFAVTLLRQVSKHAAQSCAALALSIPALFGLAQDATARTLNLVALGDSLTAGYELPQDAAFPVVLEAALRHAGYDVRVINAGVSGNTAADGLARLDWSVQDGTDGVILELGANDMLQGRDPAHTGAVLDRIVAALAARHIKVLIAGMLAAPNLGTEYQKAFDRIYPELAAKYRAPLYPFFMKGVVGHTDLMLADGLHPNAAGVKAIVAGILPTIETFLTTMPHGS